MALGPGPAGLKFWTPAGVTADNTDDINNLPASVGDQFNPWGPKRPVQDWFLSTSPVLVPAAPFTLTGDAGSYTIAGSVAGLAINDPVNLPAGFANSFNPWRARHPVKDWVQGSVPAVPVILTAAGGSYTITGTAAILALGHAAGAGSYTITGTAAGLVMPGGLPAAAGSYALTGSAAALTVAAPPDTTNLPAGMTGSYVPWRRPFPVSLLTRTGGVLAAAGPVTLTAASGSYTITGTAASLTVSAPADTTNLPAGAANWFNPWGRRFPINLRTGTGRTLAEVQEPVTLTAAAGSYTLSGSAAALALRLSANNGSYTVSGSAAALALRLAAGSGAYTLTGSDAQLVQAGSITLSCDAGAYTLTGFAALFIGPPVEEVPPTSPGGVGGRPGRPGRPLYKRLKLKKKRKRDECEELLDYLESLPPLAEIERTDLPPLPTTQSLLDCIPPLSRPQVRAAIKNIAIPDDDDDEDAIALLLEFL